MHAYREYQPDKDDAGHAASKDYEKPLVSDSPDEEKHDEDDDEGLALDLSDLEPSLQTAVTDKLDVSSINLTLLRSRFLDRLAEVLARFKRRPRKPSFGGKTSKDAIEPSKHICAIYFTETWRNSSCEIVLAKNEGLDQCDLDYLANLKRILEEIAKAGP